MRPVLRLAVMTALAAFPLAAEAQMRPQPRQQQTAETSEQLVMAPPQGWQVGGSAASQHSVTRQMFPPGQSADSWSEMLSIQVLADPKLSPRDHVQRVIEASQSNCEASGPSPVAEGQSNGYPVATMTVTCTKGRQSGLGGLVAVKAIRGSSAVYVVQRIWRGKPFERNEAAPVPTGMLQDWSAFLRNVSLCDLNDPAKHPCPTP
ncbi:hypothetical protein A6A04_04940 [Paramagnetospirillum marisnigri]|uniref:TonB C-terminal domain-containing protein n=1 Tax=Paramagnetospirillum marisnigri TaxID=1285242 RepID=A0A178MJ75_9PROT|nr:hypothetical protein [Paramagnetospirillum marisnigri]OAN48105.1 hypothetical protein A6A04_04940 [Paramagnetospirillum marisnigri]